MSGPAVREAAGDTVEDGRDEERRGVHLVAVWMAGYLSVASAVVLSELADERALPAAVAIAVFLLIAWGLLVVADRLAWPWRGGRRWRPGWALVVDVLAAVWLVAEAPLVHSLQGPGPLLSLGLTLWAGLVFAALPYLVLAGVIAAGRSWWWPTWLVLLAVVTVLAARMAWVSDTQARVERQLNEAEITTYNLYLADVPGYRLWGWWRLPYPSSGLDATPVGVFRYVPASGRGPEIVVSADDLAVEHPSCGPAPLLVSDNGMGSVVSGAATCTHDGGALWYRRGPGAQQYVHTFSNATVRVSSTADASRDVLRRAAMSVRPATYSEIEQLLPDSGGLYQPVNDHSWMFFF
jgi:hypothetical protein